MKPLPSVSDAPWNECLVTPTPVPDTLARALFSGHACSLSVSWDYWVKVRHRSRCLVAIDSLGGWSRSATRCHTQQTSANISVAVGSQGCNLSGGSFSSALSLVGSDSFQTEVRLPVLIKSRVSGSVFVLVHFGWQQRLDPTFAIWEKIATLQS